MSKLILKAEAIFKFHASLTGSSYRLFSVAFVMNKYYISKQLTSGNRGSAYFILERNLVNRKTCANEILRVQRSLYRINITDNSCTYTVFVRRTNTCIYVTQLRTLMSSRLDRLYLCAMCYQQ